MRNIIYLNDGTKSFSFRTIDLFHNSIINDLSIRFQVGPTGLVWDPIDLYIVAKSKNYLEDNDTVSLEELDKLRLIQVYGYFKHQFTQICYESVI